MSRTPQLEPNTLVAFFCEDRDRDPAGGHIYDAVVATYQPQPNGLSVDGRDVLEARLPTGMTLLAVSTDDVISNDYQRYLPVMNGLFGSADAAVVANWHEGDNAPDPVLTAHATGDVTHGVWPAADPRHLRNLLRGLDAGRVAGGLHEFRVFTEPTHFSGVMYGAAPEVSAQFPVPLYDVEIGSMPASWTSPEAARAVAFALAHIFDPVPEDFVSVLCAGGVHCEHSFTDAVLAGGRSYGVSHILSNNWLVAGGYDTDDSTEKLDRCVGSIVGGVDLIAVHGKLKGTFKDQFRALAARIGVDVVKHKALVIDEVSS
jgi:D-tyrosyl-tRNA(Tyr) deacylase